MIVTAGSHEDAEVYLNELPLSIDATAALHWSLATQLELGHTNSWLGLFLQSRASDWQVAWRPHTGDNAPSHALHIHVFP